MKPAFPFRCLALLLALLFLAGCQGGNDALFERLPAGETGIDFTNTIVEDDSLLNPIDFAYVYNGAGVAAGDFDADGRPDLYWNHFDPDFAARIQLIYQRHGLNDG